MCNNKAHETYSILNYSESIYGSQSVRGASQGKTCLEGRTHLAYEYLVLIPELLSLFDSWEFFLEAYIFTHGRE